MKGTRLGYAADWLAWCSFICSALGLGVRGDLYMRSVKDDRVRIVLVCLHIKAQYDSGKRDKKADRGTAVIGHYFPVAGLSVEFLGSLGAFHHMIKTARRSAGSNTNELRRAGQLRRSTVKLPVFSEMLELLEVQLWDSTGWHWIDIDKKATFMSIWWAYDLCRRAGKYTHAAPRDEDHCIRANELTFVLFKPIYVGGRPVGSVVGGSALMASVEFDNLERCQMRATSHKGGALVKCKFIGRNTVAESKSLFRLWQWVICSGVLPDDELFTRYSFNPEKG
jgi:hypothetical protein